MNKNKSELDGRLGEVISLVPNSIFSARANEQTDRSDKARKTPSSTGKEERNKAQEAAGPRKYKHEIGASCYVNAAATFGTTTPFVPVKCVWLQLPCTEQADKGNNQCRVQLLIDHCSLLTA